MEHARYEALVEEAIGIKRRTRREQARLMLLIKEAADGDVLEKFCGDINLSVPAARNYLAAFDAFHELGIVPDEHSIDGIVAEMWEDVFDPTLHDARYASVDREGVEAASVKLGLKGPTKALDIAKNHKSLTVAIMGDARCADTAMTAVLARADHDPELRERLESQMLATWKLQGRGGSGGGHGEVFPVIHDDEFFWKLYDRVRASARRAYDIDDLPEHLLGYAEGRLLETKDVIEAHLTVVRARRSLQDA